MRNGFHYAAAALLLAGAAAQAQPMGSGGTVESTDRGFFEKAAAAGMSEVAEGQVAARQASDPKVKAFGQQMVADHTKANEELKMLARKKDVALPSAPDASEQKSLDRLSQKTGSAFDQAYAHQEVKDHEEAVALFQRGAKSQDAEVAAFAQKTLPVLEHHLEMARALPQ